MNKLFGGIEGGGTKFICAVGNSPDDIRREARISTTTPDETLARAIAFFKEAERHLGALSALGFASFGPIDPNPASSAYGYILPTPKPGWSNANVLGMLKSNFDIPIAFDLDVNGSAFGEWTWGAAKGLDTFIYGRADHAFNDGVALARLGAEGRAAEAFRLALTRPNPPAETRAYLGNALLRTGQRAEAVAAYRDYLETGARGETATRVRRVLARVAPESLPPEPPQPPPFVAPPPETTTEPAEESGS